MQSLVEEFRASVLLARARDNVMYSQRNRTTELHDETTLFHTQTIYGDNNWYVNTFHYSSGIFQVS